MYRSICEDSQTRLQLVKPDVSKKFYQLVSDQGVYASIDLIYGSGSLTRIETHQGSYTIKRQGFFMPFITIRKENTEADIATAFLDLYGKTILSVGGLNCRFKGLNLWKNQWAWLNEKNKPIVKYLLTNSGNIRGDVEFSKDFFFLSQIEILAALGAYLLLQLEDELSNFININNEL
ncbi:MAG: hypothetical protein J5644_00760 [Bacteroidales bacterium]|nr:hypothetical protein [Bacteroidales bacterium]